MIALLLLLLQAAPERAWLADDSGKHLTIVEESRPGYGATFVRTTIHLDVTAAGARGSATIEADAKVSLRALGPVAVKELLQVLSTVAAGKSVSAGQVLIQKSDVYESVELRVRSADGLREAVFFTASTDRSPVEWRLRMSPDSSIELDGTPLDKAWRNLRQTIK